MKTLKILIFISLSFSCFAGDNRCDNHLIKSAMYIKEEISKKSNIPNHDIDVKLNSFNRDHYSSSSDDCETTVDGILYLKIKDSDKIDLDLYKNVCKRIAHFLAKGCSTFYLGKANIERWKYPYVHTISEKSTSESSSESESDEQLENNHYFDKEWEVSIKNKDNIRNINISVKYSGIINADEEYYDLYSRQTNNNDPYSCPMDYYLEQFLQQGH